MSVPQRALEHDGETDRSSQQWLPWTVLAVLLSLGCAGGLGLVPRPGFLNAKTSLESQSPQPEADEQPVAVLAPLKPAAPGHEGGFEVRHVLVQYEKAWKAPASVTRTENEARARAEEALSKLKSGVEWSKVLAEYSDNTEARERGGSLGVVQKGRTSHFIEDAVMKLKPKELSSVVETPFGFHIFQRVD